MMNYLLAGLAGIALGGAVLMAGWGSPHGVKLFQCGISKHHSAVSPAASDDCCPDQDAGSVATPAPDAPAADPIAH